MVRLSEASSSRREGSQTQGALAAVRWKAVRLRKDERLPETGSVITQRDLTQLHSEGLWQPCVLHQAAVVVLVATFDRQ